MEEKLEREASYEAIEKEMKDDSDWIIQSNVRRENRQNQLAKEGHDLEMIKEIIENERYG